MEGEINIKVDIRLDEEAFRSEEKGKKLASGWVEIEECIKFPICVRSYRDKEDGKLKEFVSYPQKKAGDKYSYVVYPHDKELRREIEKKVLEEMNNRIAKEFYDLPIDDVRISLIDKPRSVGKVRLLAMASIKLCGITVNGITVKEGKKGLFIQMPQYLSGNTFKDTFYGTGWKIRWQIKEEVLYAYKKELEKMHKKPEREQEEKEQEKREQEMPKHLEEHTDTEKWMLEFWDAYKRDSTEDLLTLIKAAAFEITETGMSDDKSCISYQEAVFRSGEDKVTLVFSNEYEPLKKSAAARRPIRQEILVFVKKDGGDVNMKSLIERENSSPEEADGAYKEMLERWKRLTRQKGDDPQLEEKKAQDQKDAPRIADVSRPRL